MHVICQDRTVATDELDRCDEEGSRSCAVTATYHYNVPREIEGKEEVVLRPQASFEQILCTAVGSPLV